MLRLPRPIIGAYPAPDISKMLLRPLDKRLAGGRLLKTGYFMSIGRSDWPNHLEFRNVPFKQSGHLQIC